QSGEMRPGQRTRTEAARCRAILMGSVLPGDGIDSASYRSGGAMNALFRKLRWLVHRSGKEAELRQELQFHLDEEAEERRQDGLTEDAARRAAKRELGNLALVEENTRAVWGWIFLEQLVQDLRYAARTM